MAADFKSHVLLRDEKGLLGIPFKRLLLAGVGGGLVYTVGSWLAPSGSLPLAAAAVLCTVVLTGLRGGIPLWRRLIYRLRGSLLLAAARRPRSAAGQLALLLELPLDLARLDAAQVFAPPAHGGDTDLREWITFAHAHEVDGLVLADGPWEEAWDERR
jgi:hypothetical protein